MSQKYLEIALAEMGVSEVKGAEANPRIVEYDKHTSLKATSDEVAWCSSFANWVVDTAGDRGTGSASARSWLDWGTRLDRPKPGCIVVLDRKDKTNPNAAHVTFFVCEHTDPMYIQCLGGNQGDRVKQSIFAKRDILGYRDVA